MLKRFIVASIVCLSLLLCACSARNAVTSDSGGNVSAAAATNAVGGTNAEPPTVGGPLYEVAPENSAIYQSGNEADSAYLGGESYASIVERGFISPLDVPLSTFSADVDTAAYTNIRRAIENGQRVNPDMVRTEEMLNYFHYNYAPPAGESPIAITTELAACPWEPSHHLALIGLQAAQIDLRELPRSNLVFLIDVSGSMSDENKLPLVRRAFALLVEQLTENDRVSIVTYASSDQIVLAGAYGYDKATILRSIEDLTSGGGTHASKGIETAYALARECFIQGGNNRIILATDGDFNIGITSEGDLKKMIEREREGGVYLTVLGFGMGNYKDSKVETLAKYGDGNYAYVDTLQAARKVLVEEIGATLHTVAKDVKLQVEFNPATVKAYRLIGYENRMLRDEDFRDDSVDAGDVGSGHSVTALYEIIPVNGSGGSAETLKYQPDKPVSAPAYNASGEWLTVKVRYKAPEGGSSREIAAVIDEDAYASPSDNLRLAAAVAEFAQILRNSEYREQSNIDNVLGALRPLALNDDRGYVRDFQHIVEAYGRQ